MKHALLICLAILPLLNSCKKDKPAVIATLTTNSIGNITANSASSGGTITDNGRSGITQKGLCWALHAAPSLTDSFLATGAGDAAFTVDLTGLMANTTYYVRAYAVNGIGTGYGNEQSFTTSKGLATVTTTAASDVVPLSAKSGGNVVNDGGATITERGIVYATTANPTTSNFKIIDGSAGTGSFTTTLTPLASETTYYVRAYATNSYGTAYGSQIQFNAASANTVTDIDGNVYPYVTIGTQRWMSSNLKVTRYRNGDQIINGYSTPGFSWYTTTDGAYTFPNEDSNNNEVFGKYYNIPAVLDSRGVCPTGWHVPSDNDWKILEINQGMSQSDADALGLRGDVGDKLISGGASGLDLKKSGYLFIDNSSIYSKFDLWGMYWTSEEIDLGAPLPHLYYRGFGISGATIYRTYSDYAMSIRCIRD